MFKHLRISKMGYFEHMYRAFKFSFIHLRTSIKAFLHGFLPFVYDDCVRSNAREVEIMLYRKHIE